MCLHKISVYSIKNKSFLPFQEYISFRLYIDCVLLVKHNVWIDYLSSSLDCLPAHIVIDIKVFAGLQFDVYCFHNRNLIIEIFHNMKKTEEVFFHSEKDRRSLFLSGFVLASSLSVYLADRLLFEIAQPRCCMYRLGYYFLNVVIHTLVIVVCSVVNHIQYVFIFLPTWTSFVVCGL